jgi:hypothetical protein
MFNKFILLIGSFAFVIGAFRTFYYKKYEFSYYKDLDLGNWSYLVSILHIIIAIYLFSFFLNTKIHKNLSLVDCGVLTTVYH